MRKILFVCIVLFPLLNAKEIVIDLSKQKLYVKEGKQIILTSDISSGNRLHPTPTGSFSVFKKERYHNSTLYPIREDGKRGGAPMNYMLKFAQSIAIHEGYIPKEGGRPVPASHGCIRVPTSKAKHLFSMIKIGTPVKVKGAANYNNTFNKELSADYMTQSNLNLTIDTSDIEELEDL